MLKFVNAKDTRILEKDAKEFGHIDKDGSATLYAQKEFPWGVVKSKEVKVSGEISIDLNITGTNDEQIKNLMDTVNGYNKGWAESNEALDASKLVNVTEDRKKVVTEEIQKQIADKELQIYKIKKSVFNLDSISVYQKENKYYADININRTSDLVTYKQEYMTQQTADLSQEKRYTLIYDETSKKWLVNDDILGAFSMTEKKKFVFR